MELPAWRLIIFTALCGFLGMGSFGYHMTVINIPAILLQDFVNESLTNHYGSNYLTPYGFSNLWSFILSAYVTGVLLGSLMSAFVAQRFGRRASFFLIGGVGVTVGSLISGASVPLYSSEMLIVGRLLSGISTGLCAGILSMYFTEVSPIHLRGLIGATLGVQLNFGGFIAVGLSMPRALGQPGNLAYLLGLPAVFGVIQMALFPVFPESPSYLYLYMRNRAAATKAMRFFYGQDCSTADLLESLDKEASLSQTKVTQCQVWRNHNLRWPIFIAVVAGTCLTTSGLLAFLNYSTTIFINVGLPKSAADYGSLACILAMLLGGVAGMYIAERYPRRIVYLTGIAGTIICNIIFVVGQELSRYLSIKWPLYVCLVAMVACLAIIGGSLSSIQFVLAAEMSPQATRSTSTAVAQAATYVTGMILIQVFLILNNVIQAWSLLVLFVIPSAAGFAFLFKYLPETKNKSIEEISSKWWVEPNPSSSATALSLHLEATGEQYSTSNNF